MLEYVRSWAMHASDMSCALLFSTAVVGGEIAISVGVALAMKMGKKKNCLVCFSEMAQPTRPFCPDRFKYGLVI